MIRRSAPALAATAITLWLAALQARAATADALVPAPAAMVVEDAPAPPRSLADAAAPYLEYRSAAFLGWRPGRREMLIATRFGDTTQLHTVAAPGAARRQITFSREPTSLAWMQPAEGRCLIFSRDTGGGEFFQLYRLDLAGTNAGRAVLLTDGKSRNTALRWARSGRRVAFSSTRRNGKDTDIWVMDPWRPESARIAVQVEGGGWAADDWSHDETKLLLSESLSINLSRLHVADAATGRLRQISPLGTNAVFDAGRFTADDQAVWCLSDAGGEYRRLVRLGLSIPAVTPFAGGASWDVELYEPSPDGRSVAVVVNQDASSVLKILDVRDGRPAHHQPVLPPGVITKLDWRDDGSELGFALAHAQAPGEAYSWHRRSGAITRWTRSETGGLDPSVFRQPATERFNSFDGRPISALVYRPDPVRFPGRRPALIVIHGGPESQSRPVFLGRYNFLLEEWGVALVFPNVRGSSGYGKSFLALDDGERREDSVKDIGALLDWIGTRPEFDSGRVGVTGGSYGGYMTLASLIHHSGRLRCGVDVVGIANFLSFLAGTEAYRRDLRRVEYGDERDPAQRVWLERISPVTRAKEIRAPLLVAQGKNDPRVPAAESFQIAKAVHDSGVECWRLLAQDEGHGFQKKTNADFLFLESLLFWQRHLVGGP